MAAENSVNMHNAPTRFVADNEKKEAELLDSMKIKKRGNAIAPWLTLTPELRQEALDSLKFRRIEPKNKPTLNNAERRVKNTMKIKQYVAHIESGIMSIISVIKYGENKWMPTPTPPTPIERLQFIQELGDLFSNRGMKLYVHYAKLRAEAELNGKYYDMPEHQAEALALCMINSENCDEIQRRWYNGEKYERINYINPLLPIFQSKTEVAEMNPQNRMDAIIYRNMYSCLYFIREHILDSMTFEERQKLDPEYHAREARKKHANANVAHARVVSERQPQVDAHRARSIKKAEDNERERAIVYEESVERDKLEREVRAERDERERQVRAERDERERQATINGARGVRYGGTRRKKRTHKRRTHKRRTHRR